MNLKFDLDPTVPKVVIIAILIFAEGLLIPLYTILMQNRFPTQVELTLFLVGALLQLITYLLSFLGVERKDGEKEPS